MTRDELDTRISRYIANDRSLYYLGDFVLNLIEAEQCVWTQSFPDGAYYVAHDKKIPVELKIGTFCPFCGKLIKAKKAQE